LSKFERHNEPPCTVTISTQSGSEIAKPRRSASRLILVLGSATDLAFFTSVWPGDGEDRHLATTSAPREGPSRFA